jgi:hypothetical protein
MMVRTIAHTAKRAALYIAVMACAQQLIITFMFNSRFDVFANDFVVYWNTANRPISSAYELRPHYPFPYLPTMLLWIRPLSLIPVAPAFLVWTAISLLAFTWATRKYLTMGQNFLALISRPVAFCLMTGQVSVFLAAILLWSFGTSRKFSAGVALGAVATVKPQLVLLAPLLLLLRRDFHKLVAAGTAFGVILLVALVAFGIQPWIDWYYSLDNFRAVLKSDNILLNGVSPAGQAERAGLPPLPFLLAGIALGSWLIYRCRNVGPVESTAAVATASLLAAPYSMVYDLAAVVPFLVVTVFKNRLLSPIALAGLFQPLPILISTYELLGNTWPRRSRPRPAMFTADNRKGAIDGDG